MREAQPCRLSCQKSIVQGHFWGVSFQGWAGSCFVWLAPHCRRPASKLGWLLPAEGQCLVSCSLPPLQKAKKEESEAEAESEPEEVRKHIVSEYN